MDVKIQPEADLASLAAALRAHGFDVRTAERFACLIGDTPELDAEGKTVIRDDAGTILARVTLPAE